MLREYTELTYDQKKRLAELAEEPGLKPLVIKIMGEYAMTGNFLQAVSSDERATGKPNSTRFANMKTATALEALLRERRASGTTLELARELRAGGCEICDNAKHDRRTLCVVVGAKENRHRFTRQGNDIGLPAW